MVNKDFQYLATTNTRTNTNRTASTERALTAALVSADKITILH